MQHPSKTLLFSWGEENNLYLICPAWFGKTSQLEMDRQALQKDLAGAKQRVLLLQGLIQKMWISFPVLWEFVTQLLQRGDMKYDRLSLQCGKQLGSWSKSCCPRLSRLHSREGRQPNGVCRYVFPGSSHANRHCVRSCIWGREQRSPEDHGEYSVILIKGLHSFGTKCQLGRNLSLIPSAGLQSF